MFVGMTEMPRFWLDKDRVGEKQKEARGLRTMVVLGCVREVEGGEGSNGDGSNEGGDKMGENG